MSFSRRPKSPFAEITYIEDEDGCTLHFTYDGEAHSLHAGTRKELEMRLAAMQMALYTVPADQWREIKQGGLASYRLPRADGSRFVISHTGDGLPFLDTNLFPVWGDQVPRTDTWRRFIEGIEQPLSSTGSEPPMLAA
jgi:hypothetical protein